MIQLVTSIYVVDYKYFIVWKILHNLQLEKKKIVKTIKSALISQIIVQYIMGTYRIAILASYLVKLQYFRHFY